MELVSLTCFIILVSLIIYWICNYTFYTRKLPPGPLSLPFIGTSYIVNKYCVKYGGFHNGLKELCKYYKSDILGFTFGVNYAVVVQSDELLDEVFLKNELLGRPDSYFTRLRCLGTRKGITMTDGYLWHEQRTFAMKQLNNLGFGKKTAENLIHEELLSFFSENKSGSSNITLKVNIARCVMNVLWAIVTGSKFENQNEIDEILNLMNERSRAFDLAGGKLNQFPWLRFIAPEYSGYNLIVKLNSKLKNIIVRTIEFHKATYNQNETRDFIDSFLHKLYSSRDENTTFTEDQLIMVCLDFFIAGSVTTSSTLDFLLRNMILYPVVQQKIFNEISSILKPGQLSSIFHKDMMPYTQAVLLENERIYPIAPVIGPRRLLKETNLGKYKLPKNTTVFMNIYASTRNSDTWKNPEEFNPERFLSNKDNSEKKTLFTFGKGKRRCPGEKLAKDFIFLFATSFLNLYEIESADRNNLPTSGCVPGIVLSTIPYEVSLRPKYRLNN